MRISLLLGTITLFLAGTLFYAERKRGENYENSLTSTVERVLRAESRSLAGRLEEAALKADRDALITAARHRKKPPLRTFLSDTSLAEPNAPKWVIVAGRRIRAAGVLEDALLEEALEKHLKHKERFSLLGSRGKYFLFVKGNLATGQPYAMAYAPESFFSAFQASEGLRVWIAGRDGTVIFHPLHRFIGSNVSNLKPVAAGLQRLGAGRSEQFTERYLGIEGKDALGSWTTLPNQGLLVASEWPRDPGSGAEWSSLFWAALLCSGLGFGFMGVGLARVRKPGSDSTRERVFDENRLDDDAMEYLEKAKIAADEALEFARAQEGLADQANRERSRSAAQVRQLESKISLLETFQDKVLPLIMGKQVWNELASLAVENAPGLTFTVYRYSPSSYSLVPEACFGGAGLTENGLSYLNDTRIFIGSLSFLPTVLKTEAFNKWNRTRERLMPHLHAEFRVFPFQTQIAKGAIIAIFDERMNEAGELEDTFLVLDQLVRRTGSFCDSITPLLQSTYAFKSASQAASGTTLAGAPDGAGNRSRPS